MRPVRCKSEAENMMFRSEKLPKEEESRLLVLEMSFRKVSDLLMKNTSTEWKSSELQQLKNLLGFQRQFYTTCLPVASSSHAEVENWRSFWSSVADFLSEKCKDPVNAYGKLSMEFPHKQYNRVLQLEAKDHIMFTLRTLKGIMRIYIGKYEKVDCDQLQLQIFLLDVDRQIMELERCAKNIVVTEVQKKISKKMGIHFKSLNSHLKNTDYSPEGWKEIAAVVLKHLRRLDLLATKTKTDLHDQTRLF
ncbi:hypothetical protein Q7C36_014042 [Tachysurus vachellii]|uniref:Uncharacterized protein n=1 Tax=Tachysurus vachellii TaxID=175792 RepID=A0AA88SGR8_TACVA|nr:hypothetical protein Q7C36_014042 [Tachysurus vachellii]